MKVEPLIYIRVKYTGLTQSVITERIRRDLFINKRKKRYLGELNQKKENWKLSRLVTAKLQFSKELKSLLKSVKK